MSAFFLPRAGPAPVCYRDTVEITTDAVSASYTHSSAGLVFPYSSALDFIFTETTSHSAWAWLKLGYIYLGKEKAGISTAIMRVFLVAWMDCLFRHDVLAVPSVANVL